MKSYLMSEEEKLSYLMPSKKELEFNSRWLTNRNVDCKEFVYVDFGAEKLLGESPSEYRCQKCGGTCDGRSTGAANCLKAS